MIKNSVKFVRIGTTKENTSRDNHSYCREMGPLGNESICAGTLDVPWGLENYIHDIVQAKAFPQ